MADPTALEIEAQMNALRDATQALDGLPIAEQVAVAQSLLARMIARVPDARARKVMLHSSEVALPVAVEMYLAVAAAAPTAH